MSHHPSFNCRVSNQTLSTDQTIAQFKIVYEVSSFTRICDDGADQAATQQLKPKGIALESYVSGDIPDVAIDGEVPVIAGTGGLALNELVVAENATGYGLGVTTGSATIITGDWFVGRVTRAAAAGDYAMMHVNITPAYR